MNYGFKTKTLVMDVRDLNNIKLASSYFGKTAATDHNLYIQDNIIYLANYRAGLRVLKVNDYNTANFQEIGYFDVHPGSNSANFNGAWSVFPYFSSGIVLISSIERGLFVVKPTGVTPTPPPPTPAPITAPPTNSPTAFTCTGGTTEVAAHLLTDQWSDEDNHFKIENMASGQVVMMREDNSYPDAAGVLVIDRDCLPSGTYKITLYDDYPGDAFTGNAYFKLFVGGKQVWDSTGLTSPFTVASKEFSVGPTSTTPNPTKAPTKAPTHIPTKAPTPIPTKLPTTAPTPIPTKLPTKAPTPIPTKIPTKGPTPIPTPGIIPPMPASCTTGETSVRFTVNTDLWSKADNHFELLDMNTNEQKMTRSKGDYPSGAGVLVEDSACLPSGTYKITFYDDYATDGLLGDAYFKLFINEEMVWSDKDVNEVFTAASYEFYLGNACPNGQKKVMFELQTDQYSQEDNHFEIVDSNNQVKLSRALGAYPSGAGKLQVDSKCLPSGQYKITVYDDWPTDGLREGAYFKLTVDGNEIWYYTSTATFTAESKSFTV